MQGVQTHSGRAAAENLLRWWRDAGVDVLVEEDARGWLRTNSPLTLGEKAGGVAAGRADVGPSAPLPGPSAAVPPSCRERVAEALPPTLPDLLAWLRDSDDTPEARWGPIRLLPSGDPASGLMILTDMPEPGDAEAGSLLSGEVGALFDNMLKAIGRSRETIWLAPIATVRAIGRIPDEAERRLVDIARHQVALIAPKRLLLMGERPNRALIGPDWQKRRGDYHALNFGDAKVETVGTFHPSLLNSSPSYKKEAWKDLQLLMKGLT